VQHFVAGRVGERDVVEHNLGRFVGNRRGLRGIDDARLAVEHAEDALGRRHRDCRMLYFSDRSLMGR
jgi:hypothetical protein